MPLYEFTCRKCGHVFEELLSLADVQAGKVACPACKSKAVDKGFSSFATSGGDGGHVHGGGCGRGGFS
ncbi:MAG TPA: zinc ribbon domain-containing protein [Candidatus Krumholzibacteria bacterium]|nr:zinc ribbon domain-containing protein [Candidatus Krumholzibacteria bacterium]